MDISVANASGADQLIASLRAAREARLLSLADVAQRTGLSVSELEAWENGIRRPRIPSFCRWAAALDQDIVLSPIQQKGVAA